MLKPEYLFLWILFHLGAVELPQRLADRGKPKTPVTELVKEYKYVKASTYYSSEKKIKNLQELRSLALAFHNLGYTDTAFKLYQKGIKRYPKKITDFDRLNIAIFARKLGDNYLADSLIKQIKSNGLYSSQAIFNEWSLPDFMNLPNQSKMLGSNPQLVLVDSVGLNCFGLVKNPLTLEYFVNSRQNNFDGFWGESSILDGNPYSSIFTLKNSKKNNTKEAPIPFEYQTANRNIEVTDIDSNGAFYISVNSRYVNDSDVYCLNINQLKYDTSVSKYTMRGLGLEKFEYNASGFVISPDSKHAMFVSDMLGTIGKSDVLYCDLLWKDGLPKIENYTLVSGPVNTILSDFDPCFITNNIVAFASDGHIGKGGSDIYFYHLYNGTLIHAGSSINTSMNEHSPKYIDGTLYFSRQLKTGKSSLLSINLDTSILEGLLEYVPVFNNEDNIYYSENNELNSDSSNNENLTAEEQVVKYVNEILKSDDYRKQEYIRGIKFVLLPDSVRRIYLKNLDSNVDYRDIRFMTLKHPQGDFEIEGDYKRELDLLIIALRKREDWSVEIRSYTDSRGSKWFNNRLSKKRATNIKSYLEKNGIEASRVNARGMGEEYLINHCFDGAPCTEGEHRANRRTELILQKVN